MKRIVWMLAVILAISLLTLACKVDEIEEDDTQYVLTVELDKGTVGSPTQGGYYNKKDAKIEYIYQLETGYEKLAVSLDGNAIASSGVLSIINNHILRVKCTRLNYLKGNWTVDYTWNSGSCQRNYFPDDTDQAVGSQQGDDASFSVPARGLLLSGTIAGNGNFTLKGEVVQDYLNQPATYRYKVIGGMQSQSRFTGTCRVEIYRHNSQLCWMEGRVSGVKN